VYCSTCAEHYDVPVAEHGNTFTVVPIRCPKNKRHKVVLWKDPGPCHKCGTVLTDRLSAFWVKRTRPEDLYSRWLCSYNAQHFLSDHIFFSPMKLSAAIANILPSSSSPADGVYAALEMQTFVHQRKAERDAQGEPAFEMRVGIHTGPVVAVIVGVKKFAYDIWGDTVDIASRMESSGEVGQVNISEATYALVKDAIVAEDGVASTLQIDPNHVEGNDQRMRPAFTFTPRGKLQAKGKGEMEMYFVECT